MRSRTDYILGTDRRLFKNVSVRDPRHNSDHYMVLGCLPNAPLSETKRYLGGRKRWKVRPPTEPSRPDTLFAALRRAVPRSKPREARKNAWISAETWRLIDERVSTRWDPRYGKADRRQLTKEIMASLAQDRRRRAEEAGAEVEDLMKADPPLIQEAWYRLQGWYKAAVDCAPPPARATLKRVTAERVTLYSRIPPPGDNIPVTIEPFVVEDGVPTEAEIEWAVKCLRNNRSGGPSRMRAEDLKGWLATARRGGGVEGGSNKRQGGEENTENAGRTQQRMRRTGRGWSN